MNEHIRNGLLRELITQTDVWCEQNCKGTYEEYLTTWEEKFANLVVTECANYLNETHNGNFAVLASELKEYFGELKEYFGVE